MGLICSSPCAEDAPVAQVEQPSPYDLVNACKNSQEKLAIDLIDREGLNIDIQDDRGNTALIYAVYNRMIDVVDELLKKRVDVNTINKTGRSAFDYACGRDVSEMMAIDMAIAMKLIDCGINLSRKYIDQGSPILNLAHKHQWHVVRRLLEKDVDLSYKYVSGANILMYLVTHADIPDDILIKLLPKFDLNDATEKGVTCVYIAYTTSPKLFMRLIDYITEYKLQYDYDKIITSSGTNLVNYEHGTLQTTLLGMLCTIPDSDAAVKLIEVGADPTIKTKCTDKTTDNLSSIEIAGRNGLTRVIKALVKRGYNVNPDKINPISLE
ncbi:MAG: ankyrin repeat domain-containing protein [Faunusvirus sp.]|jgi:hypothetical protein|uniref:Ankyrin repeat domain-containing protein n=1 Tax=Faunusvirus sp. TaxID=2487766 RepID=A0A3G4ZZ02_9VIRU|nr:MAG: ankyrin repeat domain-containing protein [Faunusvirus sp.]